MFGNFNTFEEWKKFYDFMENKVKDKEKKNMSKPALIGIWIALMALLPLELGFIVFTINLGKKVADLF